MSPKSKYNVPIHDIQTGRQQRVKTRKGLASLAPINMSNYYVCTLIVLASVVMLYQTAL